MSMQRAGVARSPLAPLPASREASPATQLGSALGTATTGRCGGPCVGGRGAAAVAVAAAAAAAVRRRRVVRDAWSLPRSSAHAAPSEASFL
eukprot:SAG25_NODE_744_length_5595_cov_111.883552_7_plen_91_part_00